MATAQDKTVAIPQGRDELTKFARRAEKGDESTLPVLRKLVEAGTFVESFGNLARQVEETILSKVGGNNLLFKTATAGKVDQMRKELSGDNPTAIERLLAERIALCWLSLHETELRFANYSSADLTIKQATYWQERIDRAHRRYLTAIKALAAVRKLALPALQVNIAKKQVNIAGAGG